MDEYTLSERQATARDDTEASSPVDWPQDEDGKSKKTSAKPKKDSKTPKGQGKSSWWSSLKETVNNRLRDVFSGTGLPAEFKNAERAKERERIRREAEIDEARRLAAKQKELTEKMIQEKRTILSLIENEERRKVRMAEEARRLEQEKELEFRKEMNRRLEEEKAKLQKQADEKTRQIIEQEVLDAERRMERYDRATARLKRIHEEQQNNMERSKTLSQKRERQMFLVSCAVATVITLTMVGYGIIDWLAGGTAVAVTTALVVLFHHVQNKIRDAATVRHTQ